MYLPSQPSPSDQSSLGFIGAAIHWLKERLLTSTKQEVHEPPSLHPTVQLVEGQMLALPPFASMTTAALSQLAVGVEVPSWLMGTENACHVAEATRRAFGQLLRVENPPSSAYTAAGYELCRISHDAFECAGPGRIVTLEYDGDLAVASLTRTPLLRWLDRPIMFSARIGLASRSMAEWIDAFIDLQKPDKVMLVGPNSNSPSLADAIANSRAAPFLEDHSSVPPRNILVLEAAQAAKEELEMQFDGCVEPEECKYLRRKADAMAGTHTPSFPEPSTWPALRPVHWEL